MAKGFVTYGIESMVITNSQPVFSVKVPPMTRQEWERFVQLCLDEKLISESDAKDLLENDLRLKKEDL